MPLQPQEDAEERLSAPDWQDKYRWPDPVDGWSGALAGYPPDHPVRRGAKIELRLIARKYWADPLVTRYRKWITGWPEEASVEESSPPVEKSVEKSPNISTPPIISTQDTDNISTPKRGRPKSELSQAERQRLRREKKKADEDKPDLMSDAFAAALDSERKKATKELWAKTKERP